MGYEEWNLTIGEIVAPFGLAGEMKVRMDTDFPDRFSRLKQVCLRDVKDVGRLVEVESVRPHKGQILLKVRGVSSIEQAETLRNYRLQVRPQDAVRLPKDEYYIHELIGCKVITSEGRLLGDLTNVLRSPANDVYVVGVGKSEILLPAIRDVIQSVDITGRQIIVTPTPGLLPGDAEEI